MPEVKETIKTLADSMIARFTPPEFWPGCQVMDVTDKDYYTTDNGYIEAIVGPHGQQRVRYQGFPPNAGTSNFFVDVEFFPAYHLYKVFGTGEGGTAKTGGYKVDKVFTPDLSGTVLYSDNGGTVYYPTSDIVMQDNAGTARILLDPGTSSTEAFWEVRDQTGALKLRLSTDNSYRFLVSRGSLDVSQNVFRVDVTGTPQLEWDEGNDVFLWNKGHTISAGDLQVSAGHAVAEVSGFIIKNTSGATATAGDVGYLDENNEYKTTTTAEDERANPVAVLVGGGNNADIYVTKGGGRATLNYAGSAPSSGDFLTFSTTAGSVQARTTMHPGVVARASAAGSGGTVQAELLLRTVFYPISFNNDIYQVHSTHVSDSDFVALIDSLPGGAAVRYDTPTSGSEDNLRPASTAQLGKLVLHNTTRGNSALISDNNPTGGAGYDGEITLTAAVPGTWAAGDTITLRSQTNTATFGTSYFFDFDLSTGTGIPELARAMTFELAWQDTGGANEFNLSHPFATNSNPKIVSVRNQVAGIYTYINAFLPLIQQKYCMMWSASGASTGVVIVRARGFWMAA